MVPATLLCIILWLVTDPGGPHNPGEPGMREKKEWVGHLGLVAAVVLHDDSRWERQVSIPPNLHTESRRRTRLEAVAVIRAPLAVVGHNLGLEGNELPIFKRRKGDGVRRRADRVPADAALKVWEVAVQRPPGDVQVLGLSSC